QGNGARERSEPTLGPVPRLALVVVGEVALARDREHAVFEGHAHGGRIDPRQVQRQLEPIVRLTDVERRDPSVARERPADEPVELLLHALHVTEGIPLGEHHAPPSSTISPSTTSSSPDEAPFVPVSSPPPAVWSPPCGGTF